MMLREIDGGRIMLQYFSRENRMEAAPDKLMDELRAVVAAAEELLKATAGEHGERVDEIRARAEESLRAARERLEGVGGRLNDEVRAHPWAAVGIAAGIGLVLGILLGRR
jgi:ElaB/YqjD/DUF883 family membrane-anchored ribosome-binding protein